MAKRKPLKLEFTDPPPAAKRDYRWAEVADALRERPGEWAVVHRDVPASVPWSVNAGKVSAVHPDRGFRTRAAGTHDTGDGGRRITSELFMVYDPELDLSRAKKNGARK